MSKDVVVVIGAGAIGLAIARQQGSAAVGADGLPSRDGRGRDYRAGSASHGGLRTEAHHGLRATQGRMVRRDALRGVQLPPHHIG